MDNQEKRGEKGNGKEISEEDKKEELKLAKTKAAAVSRNKKNDVKEFCEDTLAQIKTFCLKYKEQSEVYAKILALMK